MSTEIKETKKEKVKTPKAKEKTQKAAKAAKEKKAAPKTKAKPEQNRVEMVDPDALKVNSFNQEIYEKRGEQDRELLESIKQFGILNPLIADKEGQVISGHRRLECARTAGLKEVPVIFQEQLDPDTEAIHLVEHNRTRKKTAREILKEASVLDQTLEAKGRKTKAISEKLGVSSRLIERLKFIKEHGNQAILDKIDSGDLTVSAAYAEAKVLKDAPKGKREKIEKAMESGQAASAQEAQKQIKQQENAKLIENAKAANIEAGVFKTIVAVPQFDLNEVGLTNQGPVEWLASSYPALATDQLSAIEVGGVPVADLAGDEAHLYLWCPNVMVEAAIDLGRSWGFEFATILTLCLPKLGHGRWFRENTLQCLFFVRGKLDAQFQGHGTHFKGESTADLYAKIEEVSPGPYIGLFAEVDRPSWASYSKVPKGLEPEPAAKEPAKINPKDPSKPVPVAKEKAKPEAKAAK